MVVLRKRAGMVPEPPPQDLHFPGQQGEKQAGARRPTLDHTTGPSD